MVVRCRAVTLRNTVEESLAEHVPEIEKVEVVPNEPEVVGLGAAASRPLARAKSTAGSKARWFLKSKPTNRLRLKAAKTKSC